MLGLKHADTYEVPQSQRLSYWENYNQKNLVGLRCSSYAPEGLQVMQDNFSLEGLSVAAIRGNAHVIERDNSLARECPKESIFISLLLHGDAFFYQGDKLHTLTEKSLMIYRTDSPYIFGFTGPMAKIIFDIPVESFLKDYANALMSPQSVRVDDRSKSQLYHALSKKTLDFLRTPTPASLGSFQDGISNLLHEAVRVGLDESKSTPLSTAYLLTAKQYIHDHLGDPDLTCEKVADATGISARHLTRLFENEGISPRQYLLMKRLKHAMQLLTTTHAFQMSISEIAYRTGFSSQSHFSRAFRRHFGHTPKEVRAQPKERH